MFCAYHEYEDLDLGQKVIVNKTNNHPADNRMTILKG